MESLRQLQMMMLTCGTAKRWETAKENMPGKEVRHCACQLRTCMILTCVEQTAFAPKTVERCFCLYSEI